MAIVGVSKRQPAAVVQAAIDAGLREIGENYLQEAREKLPAIVGARRHFIGHLQTNKAKAVVELFDVVQSVDRREAGVALSRAAVAAGKELEVLVQLNVSPTERFGCDPAEAGRLAEALRGLPNLRVGGVMALGPISDDRSVVERAFARAAAVLPQVGGTTLSLGMSADWRIALRAGSTMIRIGTAIFGPREAP